ncbi:hypothetical protein QU487_06690 [Crenobacter sp. SG2305]|uniref:hypothetical protein n=1 Tax=Crenobacter oryzisoli TaxID=3056844 RepID=UPI0025AB0430|nr:hypothetical protein [Crenobacter sp. SG2305]MDN0082441.1 hypothetical protein [Crenobacter sp. SG2305]
MNKQEIATRVFEHLKRGDRDWFEVEAMRHGRDPEWNKMIGRAVESCAMNIDGTASQYIPLFLPVIIHAQGDIDTGIDAQFVGSILSPHISPEYSLYVFPNLKSLQATLELDPVRAYGLAKEMAVSIFERDGLEGTLPFDHEDDAHVVEGCNVYEGVLLACLVRESVKPVTPVHVPIAALTELAKGLADRLGTGPAKPEVQVGAAVTRSTLRDDVALVKAFCLLKLMSSKGHRQAELEFTHADPDGLFLNYVVRDQKGGAIGEAKLPEGRIEDFVRHCDYLAQHRHLRCTFKAGQLN